MTRFLLLLLPGLGLVASLSAQQAAGPPNIVIFLADDAGWNDVGYHGSEIRTPHLDRLAREGVELDQFYVYPTCSPSRAALLTGRPPSRYGIHEPIAGQSEEALPGGVATLAELLRGRGYHTAISGKWHLGLRPQVGPQHFGFDHAYGALHGQVDPYTHRYKFGDQSWHRNGRFVVEQGHATDLIAREAIRFVRELRDPGRPFFLYVSFTVPHFPLDEPDEYLRPYERAITNLSRRRYAAAMTHMDEAIGRVLAALEADRLRGNTLVLFTSDNGGQESWASGAREYEGRYPVHDVLGDNAPLRGWKGELYEGGVRVPAVVSWPGRLAPRKVTDPVIVYDLLPTLAGLAGVDLSGNSEVEGLDVWPVLEGRARLPERPLYWRAPNAQAVRLGDWKLIHHGASPGTGREELFDLARDPFETQDLSARHPEELARLRRVLARQVEADTRRSGVYSRGEPPGSEERRSWCSKLELSSRRSTATESRCSSTASSARRASEAAECWIEASRSFRSVCRSGVRAKRAVKPNTGTITTMKTISISTTSDQSIGPPGKRGVPREFRTRKVGLECHTGIA